MLEIIEISVQIVVLDSELIWCGLKTAEWPFNLKQKLRIASELQSGEAAAQQRGAVDRYRVMVERWDGTSSVTG